MPTRSFVSHPRARHSARASGLVEVHTYETPHQDIFASRLGPYLTSKMPPADSGASRPAFRNDVTHHSGMIVPGASGSREGRAQGQLIAVAFETDRDGFWLAPWLNARGIAAHVIHAASVEA